MSGECREKKCSKKKSSLKFRPATNPHRLTARAKRRGNWRPTVCSIVKLGGDTLITDTWKRRNGSFGYKPDLPKGGVERWQLPEEALFAELYEEVRVHRQEVASYQFIGCTKVPFNGNKRGRDGYTKGKLYLFYVVILRRGATIAPGLDHRVLRVRTHGPNLENHFHGQKRKVFSDPLLKRWIANVRRA